MLTQKPGYAGKTVFTSDHALKLEWIPDWIAIVGSGYIGLEFSDVYTALGSEVSNRLSHGLGAFLFYSIFSLCRISSSLVWTHKLTSFRARQVTFIEALDGLMPGFDPEIGKLAQRILINPRKIDYHVGVLAKKVKISCREDISAVNCSAFGYASKPPIVCREWMH